MSLPDRKAGSFILDDSLLRAADIRGVAGDVLTAGAACAVGKAFGSIVRREGLKKVLVGGDGRLSTPELSAALTEGLVSCGLEVTDIGCCPTPALYYAVHESRDAGGVMVTASHNPKEYNGFKMMIAGTPFFGSRIEELGRLAASGDFVRGAGVLKKQDFLDRYISRLTADMCAGGRPLNIVWDCGNGTAGTIVPALTKRLAGRHIVLNGAIDGNFPAHAPDSSHVENLTELREAVLREKADLGLAFDGDADRLGVIDSEGALVETDKLLQVFAEKVLKDFPGAVIVADIKSSKTFISETVRMGGRPVIWKTGHSFIKQKMKETGAPLGGEMSGHICFADKYYGFDDALYAAVRLIDIAGHTGETLHDRIARIPQTYATPEIQIPCPDREKSGRIENVKKILKQEGIFFEDFDGIKVTAPSSGWWLLRASNTSPSLVARCEADTPEELEILRAALFYYLKNS